MQRANEILQKTFGYDDFRHHQSDIIQSLTKGEDALVLMPTGGGKSLCYQIPALIREGTGIVISPLIALMQDQVDALRQLDIRAAFLNSSLDADTRRQTEQSLINGDLDLLYVAPERLLTDSMLGLLSRSKIALFAIDEAHCVSQWGHDFRKDYQQLSILHERFPDVPRLALTATADQRTRQEIIEQLQLQGAKQYINSFDRPNIRYTISDTGEGRERLWQFIRNEHPEDAGIVYCLSRDKVEKTAAWLNKKGRTALPYHAGLDSTTRQHHQTRFLREEGIIIVATIAFGMGIDKPDVRFVAHLNLPKSIEAYYQETGRAGRDGQPANVWMAYGLNDVITLRRMTSESDAVDQFKRAANQKLEAMLGLCELTSCRRQALLAYFDEHQSKPCGNCDNCLNPPETWDGVEAAQKALSCVYHTGQRFGVNYIIDVLMGKDDERIKRFGHDQINTFGLGQEISHHEWRSLFRQLIAQGYLDTDTEGHGSLRLTEQCRPLLRGEIPLPLRKMTTPVKTAKTRSGKTANDLRSFEAPLFEALRAQRKALAEEQGVPPYVIFHDNTLLEMTRQRPDTLEKMAHISGIGERKLDQYGKSFLNIILAHPVAELLDNNLSDTVNETLNLYAQGENIDSIAKSRNLTTNTIYSHLATAIETGLLTAEQVLPLDEQQYREIRNCLELHESSQGLRPVFEDMDEQYEYGILKCVQASIGLSAK